MRITAFAKVACITFPGAPDRPNRLKKQIDATIREPKIDQQLCGISGGRKEEFLDFTERHLYRVADGSHETGFRVPS
jgi:hypothetical protein